MRQKLDIDNWARKEHFLFYKNFEEPFYGFCIEIDCTDAYHLCKERGYSFFLYYLHKSLVAVNSIEPFRYRIESDEVYIYDRIAGSSTINRADETFGFGDFPYYEEFEKFQANAKNVIENVRGSTGLDLTTSGIDTIHYSAIPWFGFTGISHARRFSSKDSCPKISFGKMMEKYGQKVMPVSIHVHHALVDGFHVGQFVDLYQRLMNELL